MELGLGSIVNMCNYFASNDCCGEMMVPLMENIYIDISSKD